MYFTASSIALIVTALLTAGAPVSATIAGAGAATCVGNSSYPCLSNKLIAVVRRIHNIREIPITEWMSLVPSTGDGRSRSLDIDDKTSRTPPHRREGLIRILGNAFDDFIESRSLRIALPSWATPADHAIDFDVGRAFSQVTGRKKDKGMKGMGMIAMMMMGKMMMMSMGMVKMKAMGAMMVGMMALMLSKVQLFKMLMDKKDEDGESKHVVIVTSEHGGGGGGGGGHGGGGGGGHGGGGGGGGHGGGGGVSDSYGPPSSGGGGGWSGGGGGGGGGWSGGGGGGGWSGGGGGHGSSGSGGDSWGGGGGGGSGWSSGGGSGGDGGGYSYGPPAGGGGGYGGGSGGWGKRAYHYDTYVTHTPNTNTTTE